MLHGRLVRHGITLTAAAWCAALTTEAGAAAAPAAFVSTTAQAASQFAAGQAAGGALSPHAAVLAKGGLKLMFAAKVKLVSVAAVATCVLAAAGVVTYQTSLGMTKEQKKAQKQLQGTWKVVAYTKDGKEQPKKTFMDLDLRLVFKANTLGKLQTAPDGRVVGEKGLTFTLDPSTSPQSIDFRRPGKGETVRGIYEIKGGTLKLCIDRSGKRPTSFKAGAGQMSYVAKRPK